MHDITSTESWGKLENASLIGNFLGSPGKALILNASDRNVTISNNSMVGSIVQPKGGPTVDPSNATLDPEGNGAAILAQRRLATVRAGVCS